MALKENTHVTSKDDSLNVMTFFHRNVSYSKHKLQIECIQYAMIHLSAIVIPNFLSQKRIYCVTVKEIIY